VQVVLPTHRSQLSGAEEPRPGRPAARLVQPIGPGGKEEAVLFDRSAAGLQGRQVLTLARFVRLHGQYGFPSRS